jgi:calcineurin-like phosphoesterase family protein
MTTWFTADWHLGHANIIRYCARPFANTYEMQREIEARHNALVSPDDDVWHLGDVAMNEKYIIGALTRMNGRFRLVAGNHDKVHPHHKHHESARRRYINMGFAEVYPTTYELMRGVLLCHFPSAGDSREHERFEQYRPKPTEYDLLLCGHVHEKWRTKDRMVNVGVDQWAFSPVRLYDVLSLTK